MWYDGEKEKKLFQKIRKRKEKGKMNIEKQKSKKDKKKAPCDII